MPNVKDAHSLSATRLLKLRIFIFSAFKYEGAVEEPYPEAAGFSAVAGILEIESLALNLS